jgi:hypothetical protein
MVRAAHEQAAVAYFGCAIPTFPQLDRFSACTTFFQRQQFISEKWEEACLAKVKGRYEINPTMNQKRFGLSLPRVMRRPNPLQLLSS